MLLSMLRYYSFYFINPKFTINKNIELFSYLITITAGILLIKATRMTASISSEGRKIIHENKDKEI